MLECCGRAGYVLQVFRLLTQVPTALQARLAFGPPARIDALQNNLEEVGDCLDRLALCCAGVSLVELAVLLSSVQEGSVAAVRVSGSFLFDPATHRLRPPPASCSGAHIL